MITYLSNIIPRIQQYSQKLDNLTLLMNQKWVCLDNIANTKMVYIFLPDNELIISINSQAERAKWQYLGNDSLLIDSNSGIVLLKHGFFDDKILALKLDSKDE